MNTISRYFIGMFACVAIMSLSACGGNSETTNSATHEHEHEGADGHVHIFACPMHPEVTGHEGEKCSKCGMDLVHNDNAGAKGNFKMQFASTPASIEANKKASLSFTPQNLDNADAAVPLDVTHEKKIHLIGVSEDLSWFTHIHPEYQSDGSYVVEETFPSGGNYILYADYKPSGANHQLEKVNVTVQGKPAQAKSYTKETRVFKSTDGISLELKPDDPKFLSNQPIHFDGIVSENGKPIDVHLLDMFLGAPAHSVMIETTDKSYNHVHPEIENTILHFHTTFEKAGTYRVWVQFVYKGKLHTCDFTLVVEPGNIEVKSAHDEHEGHSH